MNVYMMWNNMKEIMTKKKLRGNIKGIEYDYNGRIIFEGEYLDQERWKGKFKEYHENNL